MWIKILFDQNQVVCLAPYTNCATEPFKDCAIRGLAELGGALYRMVWINTTIIKRYFLTEGDRCFQQQ